MNGRRRIAFKYDETFTSAGGTASSGKSLRGNIQKIKQILKKFVVTFLAIVFGLAFAWIPASQAQVGSGPIWVVRSLYTSEYGVTDPRGLAFSPQANTFFVLDGNGNATLITMREDPAGTLGLPEVQADPLNTAFDQSSGGLFVFDRARSELVKIQADERGLPDAASERARFAVSALGVVDPAGMAFSPDGRLFILDAASRQIVSVAADASGLEVGAANRMLPRGLGKSALRGLAYHPSNGHLYVAAPAEVTLYELDQSGEVVSSYDLAALGIENPSAMTFAPSVDTTDDPNTYDLFVLDAKTESTQSQIVELSLIEPAALPSGTTLLPATLVKTVDTSNKSWNPSSPDPAGIAYLPHIDRLLIVDSEVEEMPAYWVGANAFIATRSGSLSSTCDTTGFTKEPTGAAFNPNNNHIFISSDSGDKVFEIDLGPDGKYCTADDIVTTTLVGSLYGVGDAEDVAYGSNTLFIAGGTDAEVYRIPLGPNGVLGGGDDGAMTHFDTLSLGFTDLEGIGYNDDAGTLFIVSLRRSENYLGEVSTTGTLLRAYDLSFMGTSGGLRADVVYAPSSANASVKNIYIVSRGVDNNSDPNENDGKWWEISIGSQPVVTPTRTNTPSSGPTPTPTRTPTPSSSDLIFADGFESGNLSAWTSSVTDGGDLSVTTAAALVGTRGMQAVINNNTSIYVADDIPNAEPRYRARFYFDPNSITMASGDNHFIFHGNSGTSTLVTRVQLRFSSGSYQVRAALRDDGSGWTNTAWFTISDAPHFFELDWRAATGAGANNGGLTLWIDDVQRANLAGIDNDTRRIDNVRLGAVNGIDTGTRGTYYFDAFESRRQTYIGPASGGVPPTSTNTPASGPSPTPTRTNTPASGSSPTPTRTNTPSSSDLIFADGFESGNLSAWTSNANDSGDLSASTASALVGTRGMQAVIDDNNSIYVTDDLPNAEPRYRARFYFDPNSIAMVSGDNHFIFQGFAGTSTLMTRVQFRFSSGSYQVRAALRDDGSGWTNTAWFTISDAPHFIELDWRAATGAGANNGGLTLWIDNVQRADLAGIDNDTRRIDRVRLGAVAGVDNGTRGTYYFDAFESRRQTFIGPVP